MAWKVEINPHYREDKELTRFVKELPKVFQTAGDDVYRGRNHIKSFDTKSQAMSRVVAKKFKPLGMVKGLIYNYLRTTKAFRAYHNGLQLLSRGIDTPTPLAYLEWREGPLVRVCYYVTSEVRLSPIRDGLWTPECYDERMARDFASFALSLHQRGILHHDLNSTNVLYRGNRETGYSFELIDINRMDFTPVDQMPTLRQCMENITRFTNSLEVFRRVARLYIEARGLDPKLAPKFDKAKEDFISHRARNKRIKQLFK